MEKIDIALVVPYRFEEALEIWMQKRESNDSLNGLLEFPGGKVEAGESLESAAIREVLEETGVILDPKRVKFFKTHSNQKENIVIALNIFTYEDRGEFLKTWYDDMDEYIDFIPPANRNFIDDLLLHIKSITYYTGNAPSNMD